jgi:spore maturation protein CgeB
MMARYHVGRGVRAYNRFLQAQADKGGFDLVFVDKGVWVWPETLQKLKRAARAHLAIHFTPDAQFLEQRSRHFLHGLRQYDLAIDAYRSAGAREIKLLLQGYGESITPVPQPEIPDALRSKVCFIGHCQPHYATTLQHLASRLPLKIWGPNWMAYAARNDWARDIVQGDSCYGEDYARALSGAKIAIGLLSKRIPETTTTRSFEIPACGTMLLAERTAEHQALFEEGLEAEFFDGAEECAEKAVHYLENETARERIAAAGHARCQNSGYSTTDQFSTVVDWIDASRGV